MLSIEQQNYVDELYGAIEHYEVPMAVVDYLGRKYQVFGNHDLKFATVTHDSALGERFGTRDLRHVEIYNLQMICKNIAATTAEQTQD